MQVKLPKIAGKFTWSNFGENCAGKFYLHMTLPAQSSGKFTYTLFSVC